MATHRGNRRGRAAKATEAQAIASFAIGQVVKYRQGRGEFEANVVDIVGDVLTLERVKDGVKVKRPVTKVIAAP